MFFTANQLVLHAVGDYVLQSDWMAVTKTRSWWAVTTHAVTYTLPFLLLTQSVWALLCIGGTHLVIDRWRLARFVIWVKNHLQPGFRNDPWSQCSGTGFHADRPPFLAVWLLIITDNIMHVTCNAMALRWLT